MSVSCFTGWAANQSSGAAAADITYTGIAPSTSTNVGDELDWRANHVGATSVISNFDDLEALFPAVSGLHTINAGAKFTAFDGLPPGNHIAIVFPGYITADHAVNVAIVGDYAGPLISGEASMNSVAVLNFNPGGSDLEMTSMAGQVMRVTDCTFLGQGGVEVKASAIVIFDTCFFVPAASGAAALTISSTLADMLITGCFFASPGGPTPYTGVTITPTVVMLGEMQMHLNAFNSVLATDAMLSISPLATLPGGGVLPASVAGIRISDANVRGLGSLFAPGSLTEDDIEIVASDGQGRAPNTRFLGDAFVDVAGGTLIPMSFAAVPIGNAIPVPASNGVGGVLTLIGLSSHFTLDISDPAAPFLRFDGPDDNKDGVVTWSFDFIKNGAANSITGLASIEPAAGGGYVPVIGSESTPGLAPTSIPNRRDGGAPVLMSSGDKLRIEAKSDGTSAIDISQIILVGNLSS